MSVFFTGSRLLLLHHHRIAHANDSDSHIMLDDEQCVVTVRPYARNDLTGCFLCCCRDWEFITTLVYPTLPTTNPFLFHPTEPKHISSYDQCNIRWIHCLFTSLLSIQGFDGFFYWSSGIFRGMWSCYTRWFASKTVSIIVFALSLDSVAVQNNTI